ncbi:MAG: hypothetical protein IV100_30820 [Myxococcales bacterium]|nr:hypothetical protein [Myxococcales bacterium]
MTRWRLALRSGAAASMFWACAGTQVSLRSDVQASEASAERIESWRTEVFELESRRIRGVDVRAFERARSWLDRLEGEDEPEVRALLVAAITGELDVMRTAEKRYGTSDPIGAPHAESLGEEDSP